MAALHVDLVRDTTDWVLVVVSILTAFGTIGAVAVALLGPAWRERQKRPDVRLVFHGAGAADGSLGWSKHVDIDQPGDTQDYPPMWVTNERGKDPAQNVEVFVTVGQCVPGGGVWIGLASRDNLLFNSPVDGHYGSSSTHVPPGFSREVFFLTFGHSASIFEAMYPDGASEPDDPNAELLGIIATFPARRSRAQWIKAGTYAVTFVVTGSNFDAVTYVGQFKIGRETFEGDGRSMVRQTFGWTTEPARRTQAAPRRWRRRDRHESTVPSPTRGDDWGHLPSVPETGTAKQED